MNNKPKQIDFIDNGTGKHQSNTVCDSESVSPTVTTLGSGGTQQIKIIVASRGRNVIGGERSEQNLEPRYDSLTNTITTVQKDNLLMEELKLIGKNGDPATKEEIRDIAETVQHKKYRIRKLTPLECYRLMGVSDENAKKMLNTNSNTQCYKQAGNSIVVPVLMGIFSQMNIDGIKSWNDMTEDEIYELIDRGK